MELCMKRKIFITFGCAAILFAATGTSSLAQDAQDAKSSPAPAKDSSPAPKKHKVWTDDEVSTLRTPEDNYVEQKQAAEAASAAAAVAAAQQAKSKPKSDKHVGAPPALSNPKSPDDADRMIAWENRDVDAQQEFIDTLRTQLEQASPENRDPLDKSLTSHLKMLEDTKKERDALVTQKKQLEKKASPEAKPVDSVSTSTPQ
jgi:HPt (histidine-containing phosphotransfer) domain-containing protein